MSGSSVAHEPRFERCANSASRDYSQRWLSYEKAVGEGSATAVLLERPTPMQRKGRADGLLSNVA